MSITFDKKPSDTVNWLKRKPIAHRGLHNSENRIYENTISAAKAAINEGYPIELDLQLSSDRVPMVFHDELLERMCGIKGNIRDIPADKLRKIGVGDSADHIPTLAEFLDAVSERVGLVIELKGLEGADDGFLEGVALALEGYRGEHVLMSFDHHLLDDARAIVPQVPLGLTAYGEENKYLQHVEISERTQIDFTSYHFRHLDCRFVSQVRKTGRPVISWTVTNPEEAQYSSQFADQPTFEDFLP